MDKVISFNVGGRVFSIRKDYIDNHKETLLYTVITNKESIKDKNEAFFIDRNPDLFSFILEFYRKGRIIYPTIVDEDDFNEELDFYLIKKLDKIPVKEQDIIRKLCVMCVESKARSLEAMKKADKLMMRDIMDCKDYLVYNLMKNYLGQKENHHYFVLPSDVKVHYKYTDLLNKFLGGIIRTISLYIPNKEGKYQYKDEMVLDIPETMRNNCNKDGSIYILSILLK